MTAGRARSRLSEAAGRSGSRRSRPALMDTRAGPLRERILQLS